MKRYLLSIRNMAALFFINNVAAHLIIDIL